MSVEGSFEAPGGERLVLPAAADLDRVDDERASSDAIMVGAGTIRRDDPRLLIRSPERRAARAAAGRPEHPMGVTLTASGDLDPGARFFTRGWWAADTGPDRGGAPARLVYCTSPVAAMVSHRLNGLAEVVDVGCVGDAAGVG